MFQTVLLVIIPISSPKLPHIVILANGSKVASRVVCHVPPCPLNLNFVLYITNCPYSIISISQLTHSLTFNFDSFCIKELGASCLIDVGHELPSMPYFSSLPLNAFHDHIWVTQVWKMKIMMSC